MLYKYPIEAKGGDIVLHDDYNTAIQDAIRHCLMTELEERILRPEYGLADVLFSGSNLTDLSALVRKTLDIGLDGFNVIYSATVTFNEDGRLDVVVLFDDNKVVITV